MAECIFCGIVSGSIPAQIVFKDDLATAFRDLNPQAPTHLLIVPNVHISSLRELDQQDDGLARRLMAVANQLAVVEGLLSGYRVVTNVGPDAGQSVDHLHWHLLGGRKMSWPPG